MELGGATLVDSIQLFAPAETLLANALDMFIEPVNFLTGLPTISDDAVVGIGTDPKSDEVAALVQANEFDVSDLYLDSLIKGNNKFMVWWNGFASMGLTAGAFCYWYYFDDGLHDLILFIANMLLYPQNILFWLIVLIWAGLDQDLRNRKSYYLSSAF